MSDSSS